MLELYWGCLIFGVVFAVVIILFGDILDGPFNEILHVFSVDHFEALQPMSIVSGITIFGGMGLLLATYTNLMNSAVVAISLLVAIVLTIFLYFIYIKPMKNCENSTGFFIKDLIGKKGEVIVPISANGCGEVLIKIGAINTNQIAASNNKLDIPAGIEVVVVDAREGILYVSNVS